MNSAALVVSIVSTIASVLAWVWAVRAFGQAKSANENTARQTDLSTNTVVWSSQVLGPSLYLWNQSQEHTARQATAYVKVGDVDKATKYVDLTSISTDVEPQMSLEVEIDTESLRTIGATSEARNFRVQGRVEWLTENGFRRQQTLSTVVSLSL